MEEQSPHPHNRRSVDNVYKLNKRKLEMYISNLQIFKSLKKKLKDLKATASGEQEMVIILFSTILLLKP